MRTTLITLWLIVILIALGFGLFYLVRQKPGSQKMAKALTFRIALSLLLFLVLIAGYGMGFWGPRV